MNEDKRIPAAQVLEHGFLYGDALGVHIVVIVPWGYETGRIPPGRITFDDNGIQRHFDYHGTIG